MTTEYPSSQQVVSAPVPAGQYTVENASATTMVIGDNARVVLNTYQRIIRPESLEELEELSPTESDRSPYKGLAAYTDAQADIDNFFGREALSDDITARLREQHFLILSGDSGSGKSSLLRAGVAPRLCQHNWLIHIITPTSRPLEQLASSLMVEEPDWLEATANMQRALATDPPAVRLAAKRRVAQKNAAGLLLVVDQFEEVYTQCHDPAERRAFIEALLAAADSGIAAVVIALRADFTGHLAEHDGLRSKVRDHLELLGALSQADLVRVIAEPAQRGGWSFVQGLIEQFVLDVGEEPGRLPLLSHALDETWKRRRATVMTLKGYNEAGRVEGAITKSADTTYERLPEACQPIARDIFLTLTEVGETGPYTRRVIQRAELNSLGDPATINATLNALAAARLITVGATIQVAHEVLIRRWTLLQGWLVENRAQLIFHRQLRQAAALWKAEPLDDLLYRGEVLARANARLREDKRPLTEDVASFLAASREAEAKAQVSEELERERARQDVRRELPFVMIGGAIGLGLSGYLLLTVWLDVTSNLGLLTVGFVILGVIVGLLYAPVFDWAMARAGSRRGRRRLTAALLGFFIYGLALCLLNIGSPGVNFLLLFALGGIWGVAAGLGRIWSPDRLPRLIGVALICGSILGAAYLAAQLLGAGNLLGSTQFGPPPALLTFAAGMLLPLSVLLAKWMSHAVGHRSLR